MMDEEIPEPVVDASCFYFASANSPEIKQYYRMKYPEYYCLSPTTVLEQLDDEDTFHQLQNSVTSFVSHLKQSSQHMTFGYFVSENESENPAINKESTYEIGIEKPANISRISTSPASFSEYDSVHSIKVPLRTYERKSNQTPYQRRIQEDRKFSVSDLAQRMKGLIFDRVEKSIPFPVEFSTSSCTSQRNKYMMVPKKSRKQTDNPTR